MADDWQDTRAGILLGAFAIATGAVVILCIALAILHVTTRVVRGCEPFRNGNATTCIPLVRDGEPR